MKAFSTVITVLGLMAALVPVPASAQDIGSVLRFRQLGDPMPLGRGHADISVQFASMSIDNSNGVSMAFRRWSPG